MVDSDAEAEEHPSREEILAQHEPIHTHRPRKPRRKRVRGVRGVFLMVWALVCGVLFGFVGPVLWLAILGALFGWLVRRLPQMVDDFVAFYVLVLIPPVVGIGWAMLREPEEELYPETKVFLVTVLVTWLFFVYWVPGLVV